MSAIARLPALRKELSLLPAPPGDDGRPSWFLFDPVQNNFHVLTRRAVDILSHWRAESPEAAIIRFSRNHPTLNVDEMTLKKLSLFLYQQNLTETPLAGNIEFLTQQAAMIRKDLPKQLMYKSLFFRIPLFQPHKFLTTTAPYLSFLFKKRSWVAIITIGLIGLFFAARQWEQFLATFMYFFTLEGFFFYALTLIFIKILHELGHAYTAHHFGAHVPIMGIAFLLMFPVLYTDTTDAWRITSSRQRALIDAGGMIVELAIACIAIFLWSFLPDGPARSTAFFAATSSWLLSLMINLNPCMRFDGYYLLSDVCGFQNMQSSGFALGRWKMRNVLWGLRETKPLKATPRKTMGLLTYAYVTWIYRLFLFTAIALLIYHFLPKPFGSLILIVVMFLFLAAPIKREINYWWSQHMLIISTTRGRITLGLSAIALAVFLLPWQTRINAPALMQPSVQTEIFPLKSAQIKHIYVQTGATVSTGDLLITLTSDELLFERSQSRQKLKLLSAQLDRQTSNLTERRLGVTLAEEYALEEMRLKALETDIARLNIHAPQNGIISELPIKYHAGRYVRKTDRLMRIVSPQIENLIALPNDSQAARLSKNAPFIFISDDASARPVKGVISVLAPTSEAFISERLLTSTTGGSVAVNTNEAGQLLAHIPVFKVQGQSDKNAPLTRAQRGRVHIKAAPQSPAQALWRSIIRVLIRETDF